MPSVAISHVTSPLENSIHIHDWASVRETLVYCARVIMKSLLRKEPSSVGFQRATGFQESTNSHYLWVSLLFMLLDFVVAVSFIFYSSFRKKNTASTHAQAPLPLMSYTPEELYSQWLYNEWHSIVIQSILLVSEVAVGAVCSMGFDKEMMLSIHRGYLWSWMGIGFGQTPFLYYYYACVMFALQPVTTLLHELVCEYRTTFFFFTLRMSPSWLWFINLMFLLGWLTDWLTDCVFECAHACVLVQTHAHTQVCMPMCTRVEAACGYLFFSIAPNWLLWDKISYWTLFSPFLSRQTG